LPFPAILIEQANQGPLRLLAGLRVVAGLPGAQVGGYHQGKGVAVCVERFGLVGQFAQFDHRELDVVFAAEYFKAEVVGLPAVAVRQHGQTGDRAGVAIKETIVVR
jgi:hypothetical protein